MNNNKLKEQFDTLSRWMIHELYYEKAFFNEIRDYVKWSECEENAGPDGYYERIITDKLSDVWYLCEFVRRQPSNPETFDFTLEENENFCIKCIIQAFKDILDEIDYYVSRKTEIYKEFNDFYKNFIVELYFRKENSKNCCKN